MARSLGLVVACAWLVLAASASAAPTWLAPQDISDPNRWITFPEVAVNAQGDAIAVWPRNDGGKTIVETAERPAGGDWSEPVVISDPTGEDEPGETHVALDAAGNAVAVWSVYDSGSVIRTATRPAGGDWSDPEDLFTADGRTPQLAMNAAGDAVAVWNGFNGDTDLVTWAATRPADGDWSAPEDLSVAGEADAFFPQVSIDGAGNAIAVWGRQITAGPDVVRAAVRPAGGGWSVPEDLSLAGANAGEAEIAMNAAGTAVATWSVSGSGIQAAVRPPGGGWSALPDQVSALGQSAGDPAVAIDSNGSAAVIWQGPGTTEQVLRAAVRPPGGGWSPPKEVSAEEQGFVSYEVEANASAGVVATWTRKLSLTTYGVQAAVRPPGGGWSEPEDLSADGESAGLPDLGFDAAGNAVAIWGREVGVNDYVLQGAGYDFTGPRLDDLRIPAAGTVGTPVSFAVSPFDLFALGATSWAFGDGSQAAGGNSVSHVYNTPGRYPVTVTAFDGSGNASTQTTTITIAGDPIGPPPPPPPNPRRPIALALRIEGESLRKLLRTGALSVAASVNEAANVALSGQARIKTGARGKARTKLVQVFSPQTVRLDAAVEGKVTLSLSKLGRKALRSLSRVKLLIAGEARDDVGGTTTQTVTHTLR